jgi:hypothetical protein
MPDQKPLDDFIDRVSKMADELGLTDDDRTEYISRHAKAKGYRMVPTWVKEGSQDDSSSGFFGGTRTDGSKRSSGWFPSE